MKKYLGIDIGGTNTKFGFVSERGELLEKVKFSTHELRTDRDYPAAFVKLLKNYLAKQEGLEKYVGIGIPGTLSKDCRHTIDIPNIPSLSHTPLCDMLEEEIPGYMFLLENDASAAALGELYFSGVELPNDFIFITLGTGIGGAAILDGKIFKGGHGNAMEVGHILAKPKYTFENLIGKVGLVEYAIKLSSRKKYNDSELQGLEGMTAKDIIKAAQIGDDLALHVFMRFGRLLGRCIVAVVRVLDIHHIILGGGVSDTLPLIEPTMRKEIRKNLPPYYTDHMKIEPAHLANEAGIVGAAALGFAQDLKDHPGRR